MYDVEPAALPNLYHGVPLRIYGRYDQAGTTSVTIKGDVQGQPFEQSVKIELPAKDDANPEIERMWAWKRVDQLLAAARERGETASVVDEIVRLCEDFSIASEYASFIVLENDAEYQRWKIDRKNLSRLERDRTAQAQRAGTARRATQRGAVEVGPVGGWCAANGGRRHRDQPVEPLDLVNSGQAPRAPMPAAAIARMRPPTAGSIWICRPAASVAVAAIDPISAAIGLGLAGASALAARRRKASQEEVAE